jgi:nicotinate-nucleotide pyrophosphorylase (carboxylating)
MRNRQHKGILPPWVVLDPILEDWLREDIGRGDRSTLSLFPDGKGPRVTSRWIAKAPGTIAGLPLAARIFQRLDGEVCFMPQIEEGGRCTPTQVLAQIEGPAASLLMGERVALNLVMRLSGIASQTHLYMEALAGLPTTLVDTRKTTPGLRILEKYAIQVGGGTNHRLGLDDGVMLKDNHIAAMGGITPAVMQVRQYMPYPLTVEVETSNLTQVQEAIAAGADIIMLDNMDIPTMAEAVRLIRQRSPQIKIEASGNVTLESIRAIAETGVDYISTSGPITRSPWLDISMQITMTGDSAGGVG